MPVIAPVLAAAMTPMLALAFPTIDPVLISIGPFAVRWYALAYIAGLILGWLHARALASHEALWGGRPRPSLIDLDDLLVYAAVGVVFGGRLAYVVFYNPAFYLANPGEIIAVWKGGMSFHGGMAGCLLGLTILARQRGLPVLSLADIASAVAPIGLFFGRIANFINGELWGRVSDVPWAVVFPHAGDAPRHPSQLYEAATEGLLLFAILAVVIRLGGLRRPGLVSGLFGVGYAVARIGCEFFREPDPQLGFLVAGTTMGMLLSLPLLAGGVALLLVARRSAPREPA